MSYTPARSINNECKTSFFPDKDTVYNHLQDCAQGLITPDQMNVRFQEAKVSLSKRKEENLLIYTFN